MMVSACINNVGILPESLLDRPPYPSHGWPLSPRISFSRDLTVEDRRNGGEKLDQDDSLMDFVDFEFRLSDPVAMLSADELFSNGKLVPLQLAPIRPAAEPPVEIKSPASIHCLHKEEICGSDRYALSPKAPKCSSRWKEMLGLKKAQNREATEGVMKTTDPATSKLLSDTKPPKHSVRRNPRFSSNDSNPSCPLLRDSDSESASISSARISLSSSSSSGADHEDIPRLSLDLDRINSAHPPLPPRHKAGKAKHPVARRSLELYPGEGHSAWRACRRQMHQSAETGELPPPLGATVDSPRLNASGKVIFQGLGRSSSSPSFLNAGTRPRPAGVQRSYSGNVRVKPVLNVPVCNLGPNPFPASASASSSCPKRGRSKRAPVQ
ncbi:hypothetical protein KSP39_PZI020485 [Platanthera zijinensis]|uniref:Uncharacterized protein n=1 Tax=Platanthera zijinensis TaxID=2320716 RepID=A0AAP0B0H1_9ASPA